MEAEREARGDRLKKLEGAEFDREYMHEMVKDHEKTLRHSSGRAGAAGYRLTEVGCQDVTDVERHLEMARDIHSTLSGETRAPESHVLFRAGGAPCDSRCAAQRRRIM